MTADPVIDATGLSRSYTRTRVGGSVQAVRGLDVCVAAGEVVGLLGPNGAGKTTTLRMLATLLRPTQGSARVMGYDLVRDAIAVRRQVGYVPQQTPTGSDETVLAAAVFQARLYGLPRRVAQERVESLLHQLELFELRDRRVRELSGGQRRKLDLVLALVHRPRVVLFDEPTTGLDPTSRANMWRYVRQRAREDGTAVLFSTHYLHEAEDFADRLLFIDHGSVVLDATPRELRDAYRVDRVIVGCREGKVSLAADLIAGVPEVTRIQVKGDDVSLWGADFNETLFTVAEILRRNDVPITSVRIDHSSIDDVFFAITGRECDESAAL